MTQDRYLNPLTDPNLSPREKRKQQLKFLKELHKRHVEQLKDIRKDNRKFERLEKKRRRNIHKAKMVTKIQKMWKKHHHSTCKHDAHVRVDAAARFIQQAWRKYLFFFRIRKQLKQKREDAAIKIQSNWRRYLAAQKYVGVKNRRKMNSNFDYFAEIKNRMEIEACYKIIIQWRLNRKRKAERIAKARARKGKRGYGGRSATMRGVQPNRIAKAATLPAAPVKKNTT